MTDYDDLVFTVLLRILAIPTTHSGFIRPPKRPNARVPILSPSVVGISHITHHFSHRLTFEF